MKINYTIPTTQDEITLEQWMKFEKIASQEDIEQDFLQKRMLEIFCNVPNELSTKLKQVAVDEILNYLNEILSQEAKLVTTFELEGIKYGLIPDFDKDITAGELIDLDKYLELKDYSRLLSILYRKITLEKGGLYQIEPYESTHTKFLQVSYNILVGVLSFFLTLYQKLVQATLKFTQKEVMKMKMKDTIYQEKLNLLLNGVHTQKLFGF
jgi:hypothetical protein